MGNIQQEILFILMPFHRPKVFLSNFKLEISIFPVGNVAKTEIQIFIKFEAN